MLHYFGTHREGFMKHYHKRGNVETTFYILKTNFKDNVRSKDDSSAE